MDFETFYGDDWNENVETKFSEWALRVFGGRSHSSHRLCVRLTYPSKRRTVNGGACTFSPIALLLHLRRRRLGLLRPRSRRQKLLRPLRLPHLRTRLFLPLRLRTRRPDLWHLRNQHCLGNRHPDPRHPSHLGNHHRNRRRPANCRPDRLCPVLRYLQVILPLKSRMHPICLWSIHSLLQRHPTLVTMWL